jgi:hypothetical protein
MKVQIVHQNFTVDLYGFSGTATNKNYGDTAFKLMDKMWHIVKGKELKNKGINIWVYEENDKVFAGVELSDPPGDDSGLEHKTIDLPRYAYYKHIGPYNLIKQAGQNMREEIKRMGFKTGFPYLEIYGHWTNDESKLETELLMALISAD